jgi:hypothetical protein
MENKELEKPKGVDGKIIAAISYFGIIGLIVAFVLSKENKSELVLFHLKQSAGLQALYFVVIICCFILAPLVLVLMIMGIINAFNEKMKPLPIIGIKSDAFFSKYIN